MTIADAISSMQSIEAQIMQISGTTPTAAATPAGTSSTASTSGTDFANTLESFTGATVTPSAGQMVDNGTTGADIVADAQKYIGVPYVFGGTTTSGMDCSGLVQRVYEDMGIKLPRLVSGQSTIGEAVPSLADAQPGDIISCDGGNHIVIYAGNGMIIQSPKPGGHVEEMKNWITPSNVVSIRRIVPTQTTQAATPTAGTGSTSTAELTALESLLGSSGSSSGLSALLGSSGSSSGLAALLGSSGSSSELSALLGSSGSSTELSALLGSSGSSSQLAALLGSSGSGTSSSLIGSLLGSSNSSENLGEIAAVLAENAESSAMSAILGSGTSGSSDGSDSSGSSGISSLLGSNSTDATSSLLSSLMSGGAS